MKKYVAYFLTWGLFWFGHFVSKIMNTKFTYWMYPIYNWSMVKSCYIQEWGDLEHGPWW